MIRAVEDVSLHVREGEFCAVMGPSGCGKSTLLNLIAGFDVPSRGQITVNGRLTDSFTDAEWTHLRRDVIGMIFQAFHLVPGFTVGENVALPLVLSGKAGAGVTGVVRRCLEWVGLGDRERHRPGELSGGEQQRAAIARALVHDPRLILADEPTGNLDSKAGDSIISLLRSIPRASGSTVILATHAAAAARQADRIVTMKDGRIEIL